LYNPTIIFMIVFICTFGGALLGMWLHTTLPEHHLDDDSKETVKLCIGLIATMAALVLGLVTASANSSFNAMDVAVKNTAIDVLTLDRELARYGPETGEIRKNLQRLIGERIEMIWPKDSSKPSILVPMSSRTKSSAEELADAVRALKPRDDSQRALKSRALDLIEVLLKARWLILAGTENSIPMPYLVIIVFWLTIIFAGFGLFAPRHITVLAVFFVCAVSVGSAVFLILEMGTPFEGLLKISAEPIRYAYMHINQ
jgi:hypothetical protein